MNASHAPLARIGRLVATLLLAGGLVAAAAAPATARTPVDPTTLNPPPPDFFGAECDRLGSAIRCSLAFSDPELVDEPSGLACDGAELRIDQARSVTGVRWYDSAGNLVQRHFRESLSGRLVNPATGGEVRFDAFDTVIHDLAVPGDLDSGTIRITGRWDRFWTPGGGTVLHDTGTFVQDATTGELLKVGGPHPLLDPTPESMASLCAALA